MSGFGLIIYQGENNNYKIEVAVRKRYTQSTLTPRNCVNILLIIINKYTSLADDEANCRKVVRFRATQALWLRLERKKEVRNI